MPSSWPISLLPDLRAVRVRDSGTMLLMRFLSYNIRMRTFRRLLAQGFGSYKWLLKEFCISVSTFFMRYKLG